MKNFLPRKLIFLFSVFQIERGPATQYLSVPVPRGISPMNQHQEPIFHEHSRTQPRVIYSQPHASQHTQHSRQFDGQQVYYAASQPLSTVVVDQPTSYTTAVLPNGQTVYLNASQFSYSAAQAVQYQAPHHQPHMIHAQHQVQGQDYMTVMPMQPGGHIAYYQGVEGNARGPQVILNQPVTYPRGVETAPVQGRAKEVDRGGKAATKGRRGGAGPAAGRRDDPRAKQSTTSPLLDDFRTTKNRDWTMLDITGHVMEFCQDQNGSRFIQQRLEIGNASEQNVVMAEVLPVVRQLRTDVFGNYVVQKLLEFGTSEMKAQLRDTLRGEMLPLSLQMYGCRVVQKALETLEEDDLPKLLIEFHHNVLSCIHDQNGNHVIQKCIEVMSTKAKHAYAMHDGERANFFGEQIDFIINDVLDNVTSLSCHPYGCRVLQRILEHCVEPKKILALDEIAKCHKVLLDDQYGNYVIQHVLQYGRHQDRESIIHIVIANGLLPLSKQKFASNVVEKLLKYGTPAQRNLLVREMLVVVDDPNSGGSSVVLLMVRDAYANYVVQTTLDVVSEGEEKRLLLEELNAHSAQLVSRGGNDTPPQKPVFLTNSFILLPSSKRQYTFAKHIVTKLSS
jgi:pumilio RNA-binding family